MGMTSEALYIINLLVNETKISKGNICLVLTKIRLNDTFEELGIEFGMSSSNASNIFRKSIPVLANFMKRLIVWPSSNSIKGLLPIAFRCRYSNVQTILDCFEIRILKPSNAIHQALTWSDYKKDNASKILISTTPDGTINFISEGFGGRASDATIVQESKYTEALCEGCDCMADRGFKDVEQSLRK